jgi:hypothetical protein
MDAQTYINELFADSLYQEFNNSRFGITGCKKHIDADYAYEMKQIYERGLERQACNLLATSSCCSYQSVEELINTM